jgi:hypothetical protein
MLERHIRRTEEEASMTKALVTAGVVLMGAVAIAALGVHTPAWAQTSSIKMLTPVLKSGGPGTPTPITFVRVWYQPQHVQVQIASTPPLQCNVTVASLDDALALRAQIVSDKTTGVTCGDASGAAGDIQISNPISGSQFFRIDGAP